MRCEVQELEQQNRDLVQTEAEKNQEIATLTQEMQRLKKQLETSAFVVENQKQQIALLENYVLKPKAGRGVPVDAVPESDIWKADTDPSLVTCVNKEGVCV